MTDYDALLIKMRRDATTEGRLAEFGVAVSDAMAQMLASRSDAAVLEWLALMRDRVHSIKVERD